MKIIVPGDTQETLSFATQDWIDTAKEALRKRGTFYAALSGGSTPLALFEALSNSVEATELDWENIHLFWSDERAVLPDHPDSNYGSALKAGLIKLPLKAGQVHPMPAIENAHGAEEYEQRIKGTVPNGKFDLIMLGMGTDGHTASLFPETPGLKEKKRWVISQDVPGKGMRMTFTFPLINKARKIVIYVLGKNKASLIRELKAGSTKYPIAHVKRATWILDNTAANQ